VFVAYLKEYTKWRKDDGKNDLADIAVQKSASSSGTKAFDSNAWASDGK